MRRLTTFPGIWASPACGCDSEFTGKTGVEGRLEVPSAPETTESGEAGSRGDDSAAGLSPETGRDGGDDFAKAAGPPSTHVAAWVRMPLLEARGGDPPGDAARQMETRGKGRSPRLGRAFSPWLLAAGVHDLPMIAWWTIGVPGVLGRELAIAKLLFSMGELP